MVALVRSQFIKFDGYSSGDTNLIDNLLKINAKKMEKISRWDAIFASEKFKEKMRT